MSLPQVAKDLDLTESALRQYASEDYQKALAARGIQCSMSRKGNCWDNAVAESFFSSLKMELVHDADFATHEQARTALFEYIEVLLQPPEAALDAGLCQSSGF